MGAESTEAESTGAESAGAVSLGCVSMDAASALRVGHPEGPSTVCIDVPVGMGCSLSTLTRPILILVP